MYNARDFTVASFDSNASVYGDAYQKQDGATQRVLLAPGHYSLVARLYGASSNAELPRVKVGSIGSFLVREKFQKTVPSSLIMSSY